MSLTITQRLDRLAVRLEEIRFWLVREYQDLEQWRFEGDPLALGQPWPTREGVVRLEHPEVHVPAAWPLEESRLELNVGGESLLRIHYGGNQVVTFGLDPNHQRFPLSAHDFSLEVRSVARFPFGQPNRNARLERARLVWWDMALEQFLRLEQLVLEAATELSEHEVADPLLACAERALALLDWPSASDTYLARVIESESMLRMWRRPQDLTAHPAPLTEVERQSVREATAQLQRDLNALQERYSQQGALMLSGHAHIDLAWLWPLDETRRKGQRTFATALNLLDRYPEFKFNQSTAQLYAFLEQDNPELFASIKAKAEEGRWETIGGMWVEPDTNMPTGESLARQLLYGQRYFKRVFGKVHDVCWLPDCFGFSPALPQLLKLAGIGSFFTIKVNWSETNTFPYDLFWWEGLDGSQVLAHTFNNPVGGYNGELGPRAALNTWRNYQGKHRYPRSLLTIGFGDGGGGVTEEMLERSEALQAFPVLPKLGFGEVSAFYREAHEAARTQELPVWVGEIYLELHRGTLTTQGRTKYLHRRAERDLIAAEVLSSMNTLLGGQEPTSLEPQWQILLRNEFHDILPGSSIREVYETANSELTSVIEHAREVIDVQLASLEERLTSGGEHTGLLVVNPDLSPRPLRLELAEAFPGAQAVEGGHVLAKSTEIAGLEARIVLDAPAVEGLSVSERHLENAFLRVEFAPDGSLSRVYDKRAEREVLAGRGNQLWAYVDKPRQWDAWDVDSGYRDQGQELAELEQVSVIESGPHRAALRLVRRFRNSIITQDIRLWANSARLEFKTTLDWRDRRWLLKARFPLNVRSDHATFEGAFGVIRRSTRQNTSWERAQFEVAGHRFADLSEPGYGVALLNDGKYGHHAFGNELGLSLLRSPVWPDAYADEGVQTFTYALYPHPGDWLSGGVLREAEDLNRPLLVRSVRAASEDSWQALTFHGVPLGLGALKVLEDGGGLALRTYEPQGARGKAEVKLPSGWELASELNLLEESVGVPELVFRPFQVRTWSLEKRPPEQ
jgi:alpha-mannosidase